MDKLVLFVPNFSEGRDDSVINQIVESFGSEVNVIDVSKGKSANRTVISVVGGVDEVIEASIRGFVKASQLIDMRKHSGEHSRFGACDVLPFVPLKNVTMEECVEIARKVGSKLGNLGFSIYMYEEGAFTPERKNLSVVRSGEYEGLKKKLEDPKWKPDFGPEKFNPRSGASAVGARNFLIAVNFNLNSTSTRRANAVAFDVREMGRVKRKSQFGEIDVDEETKEPLRIPGTCVGTKARGWFIEEYGCVQVTMNICNVQKTPLHVAYEEVVKSATGRGMFVTGTEIVGMISLSEMLRAGKYFLKKQKRSVGLPDSKLVDVAIQSMGLSSVRKFDPLKQIIENRIPAVSTPLCDSSVSDFVMSTASESPAPGGGSVAALVGGLAAALGTMVANLSSHKRGWDEKWEYFSDIAEKGMFLSTQLLGYVDEDTKAFVKIMECFKLPRDQENRKQEIANAYRGAIDVPLNVMKVTRKTFKILELMAKEGLASSVSDIGVGVGCMLAAMKGAYLNVLINVKELKNYEEDKEYILSVEKEAGQLYSEAMKFDNVMWELILKKVQ